MFGVLTNYKEWYIVRYDRTRELPQQLSPKCFEISDCYRIINQNDEIDPFVVNTVSHLIEHLLIKQL